MNRHAAVVQASAWYPPHHSGGTEVYLSGLVEALASRGFTSTVLTPRQHNAPARYVHDGAEVETYPPLSQGEAASLAAFRAALKTTSARIYHQHSWTPDCGADHLRAARDAGLKTVLTVHVPGNLCMRGTMMRFGREACDGLVDEQVCAACWVHSRGAPRALAETLSRLPAADLVARFLPGRAATATSARRLARTRIADVAAMVGDADRIVAVCQWLHDALALNGAPLDKLLLSRQGVSLGFLRQAAETRSAAANDGVLRVLYVGRWHPTKGIDVVVRALRAAPDLAVSLTIHALSGGAEEAAYRARVIAVAGNDHRVVFADPLEREAVAPAMASHDLLVVPSTWLETGPLVALEALAVGLPVLGSRLGGLVELIDHPAKGMLVAPNDPDAWRDALRYWAARPPSIDASITVRTMDDAAAEMVAVYESLG